MSSTGEIFIKDVIQVNEISETNNVVANITLWFLLQANEEVDEHNCEGFVCHYEKCKQTNF